MKLRKKQVYENQMLEILSRDNSRLLEINDLSVDERRFVM